MNFITYNQLYQDVLLMLPKISDIHAVIGIPRSGMFPASIIATELHIKLGILGCDKFFSGSRVEKYKNNTKSKKVLIIDDSVNSGRSIKGAALEGGAYDGFDLLFGAVYVRPGADDLVDVFSRQLDVPRIFEWNLFNSSKMSCSILDMDGVLCLDPPMRDDDGLAYQDYIANAPIFHKPSVKINTICTNRIERWRGITEAWLQKSDIQFDRLVMSQHDTAEKRRLANDKVAYKASVYINSMCDFFVESCTEQAIGIARCTNKPVLSLENKKIYG